jgi:ATP-binding cassette subfamily B protein
MEFPDKFNTKVGERGITLSGGQKQRISIARALIRKPEVLVFDDCLSAVDTITEEQILQNLRKSMIGRTTVLVSHRVSTVKDADQIIVLEDGQIVEQGNHENLLEQNGVYANFVNMQAIEEA